jgi:16S rRNA (adenine1518-N6/adenine1519-N6)-dimethyltransferase
MFENDTNFLDQHFLVDENIIKTFIDSCEITKDDIVLEVGPGKGVLTKYLKEQANKLLVIEKDVRLIPFLKDYDVTYRDVLHCDIPDVNKIVTSLPYSITEPFLYKLLDVNFDKLIMMCGKNFVDNLESNNTKLSIMCNLYFNYTKICDVKPDSFNPKPKVMSSLITMTKKDEEELSKKDKIVRLLYKYRYMKVKNALKEILIKLDGLTQRQAKDIIKNYNINEDISNKLFDELSNFEVVELYKQIN